MNKILSKTPGLTKFIEYSLPVFIICVISRTFPVISFLYYAVPALLVFYTIIGLVIFNRTDIDLKTIIISFAFPAYCLISSAWSAAPLISLGRSLYLILIYAGIIAAVFILIKYFPQKSIKYFLPANILILVISLISIILSIPANSWSGGNGLGFMGFAGHQNTLASALLFTLPGAIALSLKQRAVCKENFKKYCFIIMFIILLFTLNFLLIIITYSRASVLSLTVGILAFLLITKSKKILAVIFSLTAMLLVLYFTIQPINDTFNRLLNKDGGNILDRRMILWEPSFEAARLGGFFGLGYGVSSPNIKTPELTGSHYEDGRYIREKGNSVLAMIEETGFMGLVLFLLPVFLLLKKSKIIYSPKGMTSQKLKNDKANNYTSYTCLPVVDPFGVGKVIYCTLISMIIHAQFEAWWVGPGSIHFPLYLIILFSALLPLRNNPDKT